MTEPHWSETEIPESHRIPMALLVCAIIVAPAALLWPVVPTLESKQAYFLGGTAGVLGCMVMWELLERVVKRYYMN